VEEKSAREIDLKIQELKEALTHLFYPKIIRMEHFFSNSIDFFALLIFPTLIINLVTLNNF